MTKIAVTGAAGKMGRTLIQTITETEGLEIAAAIEQPGLSVIGADAGELAGVGNLNIPITDRLASVCEEFDVLIDFTIATAKGAWRSWRPTLQLYLPPILVLG